MKFELGQVVITRTCLVWCNERNIIPLMYIARHHAGDWGDLGGQDKALNDAALIHGGRLFSAYDVQGERLYVITEHDHSYTTVMLSDDY